MKQSTNRESIENVPDELAAEALTGLDGVADLGDLRRVSEGPCRRNRGRGWRGRTVGDSAACELRATTTVLGDPAALVLTPP
jgi:hypothetical protein